MPKDGKALSTNNIQAIGVYIKTLAQKSYPAIAPTWASLNANLFQRSCVQCHRSGVLLKNCLFDTYAGVAAMMTAF